MNTPTKIALGYLAIGTGLAIYRAAKELSKVPEGAEGYTVPILTGALLDVVAWPYTVAYPTVAGWLEPAEPAPRLIEKKDNFSLRVPSGRNVFQMREALISK